MENSTVIERTLELKDRRRTNGGSIVVESVSNSIGRRNCEQIAGRRQTRSFPHLRLWSPCRNSREKRGFTARTVRGAILASFRHW